VPHIAEIAGKRQFAAIPAHPLQKKKSPRFFHQIFTRMKLAFILAAFAAFATSCSNANGQPSPTFTVHAEIMAPETPAPIKTARNVAIGNQGVTACFDSCYTQITLNFCGQALIEFSGQSPDVYAAKVFQLEPGVWTAEIDGGQWVTIYAETGNAQCDIGGQFRAFWAK
jgi:hypothetical protein